MLAASARAEAASLDSIADRIDLSGFLEIRMWSVLSRTHVPGKFISRRTYKHVNYFDLFFRNRIGIAILPEVEIRSVFDLSSFFGKGDFSMDGGAANLITRDVYALFRPLHNAELTIGLQPFSLPGGYILARDATGIQYTHTFPKQKVSFYAAYIKAYDDADDSFGQGSDMPDFIWDDIVIAGTRFAIGPAIRGEAYYVYEDDRFTTNRLTLNTTDFTAGLKGDRRKGSIHWAGLHAKVITENWFLRIGGIFNAGTMYVRNEFYAFRTVRLLAGLFEAETGITAADVELSALAEGATGNPDDVYGCASFQDIKGAHTFSFIAVDSTGGLSLRGSGESCWYGLYGCGLSLKYTLMDSFIMQVKLLHFGTMEPLSWRGKGVSWYGDEVDLAGEFRFKNLLSVFLNAGGFLPQRAYSAQMNMSKDWGYLTPIQYNYLLGDLDNDSSRSMIFEIMVGVRVAYD
jgi:hypothetical protein